MYLLSLRSFISGGLVLACLGSAGATAGDLPDFSAEMHVIDRDRGEMYSAKVEIGKLGQRSETDHPRYGRMITIASLKHMTCSTYLVNKKAYYVEKLDPASPDCDLDLDRLFGEYADTRNTYSYHVLGSTKPCKGFKSHKIGQDTVNNRQVIKWECTDPASKATYTEWFDPQLGRVIKHQELRIIKEFTNIRIHSLAPGRFAPLTGYQKYTQNDFFDLLRIPAFSTNGKKPADMNNLLPNDRLQICMENCQATQNRCATAAKNAAANKKCDDAFDACASDCEKKFPPQ